MFKKKTKRDALAPHDRLPDPAAPTGGAEPVIYKMVKKEQPAPRSRRDFIKNLAGGGIGIAGVAAAAATTACKESAYIVQVNGTTCTCHVVCACDTVDGSQSTMDSNWERQLNGQTCTCDTVCTCNTVCICDTVGSDDSGGGTYWYPN
jgi:hypothetical protein